MPDNKFETQEQIIARWLKRARESQLSHHLMAEKLKHRNYILGITTITVTTITGATTLTTSLSELFKLFFGLASLTAAFLAGLQTFLKLDERANNHKAAAASYGSVRRLLELASATNESNALDQLNVAKVELDKLAKESPSVSKKTLDEALKRTS